MIFLAIADSLLSDFFNQFPNKGLVGSMADFAVPFDIGTFSAHTHTGNKFNRKILRIFPVCLFHKIRKFCSFTAVCPCTQL